MTGQTENINGMRMYYEVHGQGEPLVLLHGFTGPVAGDAGARFIETASVFLRGEWEHG